MNAHFIGRNKMLAVAFCCFSSIFVVRGDTITLDTSSSNQQTLSTTQQIPSVSDNPVSSPATLITTPAKTNPPNDDNTVDDICPSLLTLPNMDELTQDEFSTKLTDSCRYDRLTRPPTTEPLDVHFQIDMLHVESADHSQFKAHLMVQLLYKDERLNYSKISPKRANILGEDSLRSKIWVPHIIIANERGSSLMGLDGKDVFVQISPDGYVTYSYRMTTMFYCWMNLQKFPFDYQVCEISWTSWTYNVTNMELHWEKSQPFKVANNLHLTEFIVEDKWCEKSITPGSFSTGGLSGNYSTITFKFKLRREVGFYILDYFLPSIMLVITSWVTFWLQADATPPRATLGTATMLSLITLNGGLTKNLPKVSYIKASEIWFLGCATFIFLSLAEFAFVNVIWRRKKKVELKKQNSKYILKGAITPSLARKHLRKAESLHSLYKARSCSSLDAENNAKNTQANYLTVHSFPSSLNVPAITNQSNDNLMHGEDSVVSIPIPDDASIPPTPPTWTTMTPQEVSIWIDKKSRIVFPIAFLIFNLFYWSFVYAI